MKKIISISLALIMIFTMTGCSKVNNDSDVIFKKIADNLYEVTYQNYDTDFASQKRKDTIFELDVYNSKVGGCSATRVNNYVGRNLDLMYGDFSEVIVHVPKTKDRYASVGSFCTLKKFEGDTINSKDLNTTLNNLIPLSVCDGINENGVVCEMNVVPASDIGTTTGTNPGKPIVNMTNLVRFVLDNAKTAKDAIRQLNNVNICTPWDWSGAISKGWEFHYLIADEENTYVVEVIKNKLTVLKGEKTSTNYYLGVKNGTNSGMGIERRETLIKNKKLADSVDGMAKLMQLVYWTKSNDIHSKNYCYSDHFGEKTSDGTVINKSNYKKYKKELLDAGKRDAKLTEEMLKTGDNKYGLWITLHTCVFDIKNRTMNFSMREKLETTYNFKVK